ncbi:sensor histidine kinase [Caulobacter endophyticus]|uniref:histidine kinase n=1 Tax=Caulobacter endophyticus TaxID=2172652 RepID=A0A2T9JXS2_9CAUL|nr:PAS domain S-box protein [Caulobacter endophyticus]PVM88516.1 hypothetical protein DDF67_13270 [Caulobacter endophyticus]
MLRVVAKAPANLALLDVDGAYLAASGPHRRLLGLSSSGEIGGQRLHVLKPELAERFDALLALHLSGRPARLKVRVNRAGPLCWWTLTPGPDGSYLLWSEEDVGERHGADDARFRPIFDKAALGVAHVALTGDFLDVNSRFCSITGYSAERLLSMGFQAITHPEDLAKDLRLMEALIRGEVETYSLEKRYLRGDGSTIWVNLTASAVRDELGEPQAFIAIVEDIEERRAVAEALKISEAQARDQLEELEAIYQSSPVGLAFLTPELRYVRINHRLAEMNGVEIGAHLGRSVGEVAPALFDQIRDIAERLAGQSTAKAYEVHGETRAAPGQERYWLEYWVPLTRPDGALRGYNVVVEEITEQRRNEERRKLLMDELNHRVRNTLAVVQSIARQTFAGVQDEDPKQAFEARLLALAAAHAVLVQDSWSAADLAQIATAAIGLQSADRLSMTGPPVAVSPETAVSLSLVLHELATNAIKYGALANHDGRIELTWAFEQDGLILIWRERDGPKVETPTRRGFGSRLLSRAFSGQNDRATIDLRPEGLSCTIRLNATALVLKSNSPIESCGQANAPGSAC